MKCHAIIISGKVQGVGFRYHCQRKALELGISGFVRNESDRSVYVEAEGDNDAMDQFIAWCHQGPEWAHVSSVQVHPLGYHAYKGFDIRRP
jgi:acylphosphatase